MRELLPILPKPSHYAGIEEGCIIKEAASVNLHVALAFPDTYEVGMSYLGQKILYNIINNNSSWHAERVFLPESEAAQILAENTVPLATLETDTELCKLDAICFSVTHELCYADILHMLDLAGLALRSSQRPESLADGPLVIAGGGALPGAEPLAPFIDLAALGDGEEIISEILDCLEKAKMSGRTRSQFLQEAAKIPGVYVPSFFAHDVDGHIVQLHEDYKPARRILPTLDEAIFPCRQVAPVGAVHNRLALEISRGCTRGCRFCHAGMVYRPVRERSPENIAKILDAALKQTGFDEVSFLSLSAGDYSALSQVFAESYDRCAQEQISLALPSLRVGSVGGQILSKMAKLRRTGITLAPEAGSQRLRNVINKGITERELLEHIRLLVSLGWRHVKLYFMIGLPTETDEDLAEIVALCDKAAQAARAEGHGIQITAALSTFVPKPFTPFQWEEQPGIAEIERRLNYILNLSRHRKYLKIRWHNPQISHLEGLLSRADRRMADVVELAYKKGACYCGWAEQFRLEPWLEALEECGLKVEELTGRRKIGAPLPWSHIEGGISEAFLKREREKAYLGQPTADCRNGLCSMCGACDSGSHKSLLARPKSCPAKFGPVFTRSSKSEQADAEEATQPAPFRAPEILAHLKEKKSCFRIWHGKQGTHAFLSQLELQGVLEKALRKAKMPLTFSGGFHPMPLLSFTRALPVGIESSAEWFSIVLHEALEADEIAARLAEVLPEGLAPGRICECELQERKRQSAREGFTVTFAESGMICHALENLEKITAEASWPYSWKGAKGEKTVDVRPMLAKWHQLDDNSLFFLADWTNSYLSPKTLAQAMFGNICERKGNLPAWKIRKSFQNLDGEIFGEMQK